MRLVFWILAGGLAGWLASIVTGTGKRMGCLLNILVGVVGAAVGGWVFERLQGSRPAVGPGAFWSTVGVAFVGAVIMLAALRLVSPKR